MTNRAKHPGGLRAAAVATVEVWVVVLADASVASGDASFRLPVGERWV